MINKKKILFWIKVVSACSFGLLCSTSIGLHINLLQNLSLKNILIFVAIISIPVICLAYWLLSNLLSITSRTVILIIILLSVAISSLIWLGPYQEIPAKKLHTFELQAPLENLSDNPINISRFYIKSTIDHEIPSSLIQPQGEVTFFDNQSILLQKGAAINLSENYSGELYVVFDPSSCPGTIIVKIDSIRKMIDVCEMDSNNEIGFGEYLLGYTSPKWSFIKIIIQIVDFFLCFFFLWGLFSAGNVLLKKIKKNSPNIDKLLPSQKQLFFVGTSFLFSITTTAIILWKKIPDLALFIPGLISFPCVFLYSQSRSKPKIKNGLFFLTILMLSSVIVANIDLHNTKYFESLYVPLEPVNSHQDNSINSLVLSVYSGIRYSLHFGFRDVLMDRELIIPLETVTATGLDITVLANLLNYSEMSIDKSNLYQVSQSDYLCIVELSHTDWIMKDNTHIIGLDKHFFSGDEPAILVQYNKDLLLLPSSFFSDQGFCQ